METLLFYTHSDKSEIRDFKQEIEDKGIDTKIADEIANFFYEVEFNIEINDDGTYKIKIDN